MQNIEIGQSKQYAKQFIDGYWFNLRKSHAWASKPKTPPEANSLAASIYELGYSEGEIQHPLIEIRKVNQQSQMN